MFKNISKIFKILGTERKKEFKILVVLMFFSMLLETIGISSLIPLINFFTDDNILLPYNINLNQTLLNLGIPENNILNFILIIIIVIFLIKNIYLGFYLWAESKFTYKIRFDLGVRLFEKYMYMLLNIHIEHIFYDPRTPYAGNSPNGLSTPWRCCCN